MIFGRKGFFGRANAMMYTSILGLRQCARPHGNFGTLLASRTSQLPKPRWSTGVSAWLELGWGPQIVCPHFLKHDPRCLASEWSIKHSRCILISWMGLNRHMNPSTPISIPYCCYLFFLPQIISETTPVSFEDDKKAFPLQIILLMEEIRLTSWGWQFIPLFLGFVNIPGGYLGFLNHQPVSLAVVFLDPGFGPTEESNRLQQEFQHHSMPGNPMWDPCLIDGLIWVDDGWCGLGWMRFFFEVHSAWSQVGGITPSRWNCPTEGWNAFPWELTAGPTALKIKALGRWKKVPVGAKGLFSGAPSLLVLMMF